MAAVHSFSPYAYVINNPVSLIDPDGRLSQNFINQINNSPGGTTWYNTGIGFSTSGGTSMDYDGNSINWGSSHIGGVLSSIGVTYTGGGMGADIAGFIDIPGITLTGRHNQWGNSFQNAFNSYMKEWNARSDFAWDRTINAGRYNDGPIRYMGSAGDPFGFWEGIGIILSSSDNRNMNLAALPLLMVTGHEGSALRVLAAEKGLLIQANQKKGLIKAEYLFENLNEAKNFGSSILGPSKIRMYDETGKWIGWENKSGNQVYWKHGDWGQGKGSSTFPHINYNIEGQKGHFYLKDKMVNREEWNSFKTYYKNYFNP